MRISGFTMVRNATKLYYPIEASIRSILPIVDEFVVALGDCDPDDRTRQVIEGIGSSKVKIISTTWDLDRFPNGMENAHQTDLAKDHCHGDWLFYLQADEVVHEDDLPVIQARCRQLLGDKRIEGLLFNYRHFWGDYNHYHDSYGWYPREIRIIRNEEDIHSWKSAQSFRHIPDFDGINYRVSEGTRKLNVALVAATIYHYGWVRPPKLMQRKRKSLDTIHKGKEEAERMYSPQSAEFNYGPLGLLPVYTGSHPQVMDSFIADFHWSNELNQSKTDSNSARKKHKHEFLRTRILTFLNNWVPGLKFGSRNYKLIDV